MNTISLAIVLPVILSSIVFGPSCKAGNDADGFLSVFSEKRSYYDITEDMDLGGKSLSLPDGATLDFRGGCIRNGKLECRDNTFSGRSGLASDVSLSGSVTGPMDIGVFELRRGDRSFDIGRIINAATSVCKSIVIPDGRYYLQTPVKIENIRCYQQFGDLIYNGKAKDVTVFQFHGGNAATISMYGKLAYDTDTKIIDYTTKNRTNVIGVEFVNLNNSNILVSDVGYFNNNIRVSAYGAGNCYNKYTFSISAFSNEHLRIFQKDLPAKKRGWCNENIFIGGRFCNWSHFDWNQCESVAIKIEGSGVGDTYDSANSLLFLKPCLEGFREYGVYARNVTGCRWQDARTEDCGKFIKFVGDCRYNEANSMFGPETIDFEECSTFPVKMDGLFPVFTTSSASSGLVLEADTKMAKCFRINFGTPDAKARVEVQYLTGINGRTLARTAQKAMIRPRSTVHPNAFYYNEGSARWTLATDAPLSEFVIPSGVGKVRFVLTGQFSGATIYSDRATQIIEK